MTRYRLSIPAGNDLKQIYFIGIDKFGETQTEVYLQGLLKTFDFLAQYPRASRIRTETRNRVRAHRYQSHLILYVIDSDEIIRILRIRYGREDWYNAP